MRALLRAHLAAASGYRHLTRHCVVRARLLQLAMEPVTASSAAEPAKGSPGPARPPTGRQGAATRPPVTPPGPGEPIRARWTRDQSPPAA
ncbi:DUF6274 family protein [Streptomyces sp. NBC_00876]|nr:DUF6274 family protein [Streptomyces sp. NBC_00876]